MRKNILNICLAFVFFSIGAATAATNTGVACEKIKDKGIRTSCIEDRVKNEKAAEIKKKVDADNQAKKEAFDKLLSVILVNKRNIDQKYEQKFVALEIAYENKSDKDIQGIKGVLKIKDIFDDKIINIKWSYDQGAKAKQTTVENDSGVKINRFMDDHMKLWNSDFNKLKPTFEVSTIIFTDGTKMEAPNN